MYAKLNNGIIAVYPYTLTQLRADNPYTSFTQSPTAEELADFSVIIVMPYAPPVVPYTKTVTEGTPIQELGVWRQDWVVTEASEQEIADRVSLKSSEIRNQRNTLLTQSDWTQVLDAPVDQQAWSAYRQALRDITLQPGFPLEVTWPEQPSNQGNT